MVSILFLCISFVGLSLLVSCGQNVCVAGMGHCEVPKEVRDKQLQTTGTTASGALKGLYQIEHLSLERGHQITVVGSGGKPPYSYSVTSLQNTGVIGPTDGVFTAPSNSAQAKIKITDSANKSVEIQIDIP